MAHFLRGSITGRKLIIKSKYLFPLIVMTFCLYNCASNKRDRDKMNRPNILIAISNDQSFPHTSFNGCGFINTPGFDRVAYEGICFNNCIASPACAPSKSSLVTGRYFWQNEQSGQAGSSRMKKHVPFVDCC